MNKLHVGYACCNMPSPMGLAMSGYYQPRFAEGELDPLQIVALALQAGEDLAVIITVDACHIKKEDYPGLCSKVAAENGLKTEQVFLHCTHTHTGPFLQSVHEQPEVCAYFPVFCGCVSRVAGDAIADLQPARLGWRVGKAEQVAFVRRFRMKDGGCRTNPGVGNPDILHPIGDVDERVGVLRFDRPQDSVILANFGNHPDTVGGCRISGDWPSLTRHTVEAAIPNSRCIFLNGAQGDVNHVNVQASGGDLNGMFHDFDDVHRGYAHAQHIANVVTAAVLQVYEKVHYAEVDSLRCRQQTLTVPSHMPQPEQLPLAREYHRLHEAGRDAEIPFAGMELTTVVAEAERMLKLENGPETFDLLLSGIALGEIALIGLPGEPFTEIGRRLKENDRFALVLPCCITNGNEGYFPTAQAYEEGGYEARSSIYSAGIAERIVEAGGDLLNAL